VPGEENPLLPKVAAALTGLLTIVESADVAPTADAATASEKWDASAQARWRGGLRCRERTWSASMSRFEKQTLDL